MLDNKTFVLFALLHWLTSCDPQEVSTRTDLSATKSLNAFFGEPGKDGSTYGALFTKEMQVIEYEGKLQQVDAEGNLNSLYLFKIDGNAKGKNGLFPATPELRDDVAARSDSKSLFSYRFKSEDGTIVARRKAGESEEVFRVRTATSESLEQMIQGVGVVRGECLTKAMKESGQCYDDCFEWKPGLCDCKVVSCSKNSPTPEPDPTPVCKDYEMLTPEGSCVGLCSRANDPVACCKSFGLDSTSCWEACVGSNPNPEVCGDRPGRSLDCDGAEEDTFECCMQRVADEAFCSRN